MRRDDIVVVGGGVSGIAAALTARSRGASVTLIDERPTVGGYLSWSLGVQPDLPGALAGKRGFEVAEAGWNLLYDAGVNVQLNSTAWGLFEDRVLGVVNPESSYQLGADAIILATGSTDIAVPFAGWDLAGVMTARAALIAMNVYRVLPGHKVAIVGDGPDAAEARESLQMAGAEVVAEVQNPSRVRVGGGGHVEWIEDGDARIQVDVVVTAFGVQPDAALALQALAATGYSELSAVHVPLRDENLVTSLDAVYIVGDAAGVRTTAEAWAEGVLAGEVASSGSEVDDARAFLDSVRSAERRDELNRLRLDVPVS